MRPWHGVQDRVEERGGLSDRLLHDDAQPGRLALEPLAPPHRHDHRRSRPRDRRVRPPRLMKILANFFGLVDVPQALVIMVRHAAGRLSADEQDYIPAAEAPKVFRVARIWLAIYGGTAAGCVAMG